MGRNSKNAATGAPRWTYVVGALVAVGGLVWGIVNHFVDKPQSSPSVSTQQAVSDGGTAINASESAKVNIGGQIASTAAPTTSAAPTATSAPQGQQIADAGKDGVAVNASGASEVTVENADRR
jgi:hypothetical protein